MDLQFENIYGNEFINSNSFTEAIKLAQLAFPENTDYNEEVLGKIFRWYISTDIVDMKREVLLLRNLDQLVGFSVYRPLHRNRSIVEFSAFVNPKFQKMQLGSKLIDEAITRQRSSCKVKTKYLVALTSNGYFLRTVDNILGIKSRICPIVSEGSFQILTGKSFKLANYIMQKLIHSDKILNPQGIALNYFHDMYITNLNLGNIDFPLDRRNGDGAICIWKYD